MLGVSHNFDQLPPRMRVRSAGVDAAIQRGLKRVLDKVERGMNKNLSGGGIPGAYPVPRRTGHLARSGGSKLGHREGVVFNSALYARAVHDGFQAYGNPRAPHYPGRPFLDDAAAAVDPMAEILGEWERVP